MMPELVEYLIKSLVIEPLTVGTCCREYMGSLFKLKRYR